MTRISHPKPTQSQRFDQWRRGRTRDARGSIRSTLDVVRKKYNATQSEVVTTVQTLFEEPGIVFEDAKTVWRSLRDYGKANEKQSRKVDFPDALIRNSAKHYAIRHSVELTGFYTFDKATQRLPGALAP